MWGGDGEFGFDGCDLRGESGEEAESVQHCEKVLGEGVDVCGFFFVGVEGGGVGGDGGVLEVRGEGEDLGDGVGPGFLEGWELGGEIGERGFGVGEEFGEGAWGVGGGYGHFCGNGW